MKKLLAIIAFVAFTGVVSYGQTTSTDQKEPEKTEVKKCTEAEKAKCEKECAKTGAKCETTSTSAKTEKSCSSSNGGSCCSKGTTSAGGSCCQKGGATGSTGAKAETSTKAKKKSSGKSMATIAEEQKK